MIQKASKVQGRLKLLTGLGLWPRRRQKGLDKPRGAVAAFEFKSLPPTPGRLGGIWRGKTAPRSRRSHSPPQQRSEPPSAHPAVCGCVSRRPHYAQNVPRLSAVRYKVNEVEQRTVCAVYGR